MNENLILSTERGIFNAKVIKKGQSMNNEAKFWTLNKKKNIDWQVGTVQGSRSSPLHYPIYLYFTRRISFLNGFDPLILSIIIHRITQLVIYSIRTSWIISSDTE